MTGVQTCALPISCLSHATPARRLSLCRHARAPPVPTSPCPRTVCPCAATPARCLSLRRHARAPPVPAPPRAHAACPCAATPVRRLSLRRHAHPPPVPTLATRARRLSLRRHARPLPVPTSPRLRAAAPACPSINGAVLLVCGRREDILVVVMPCHAGRFKTARNAHTPRHALHSTASATPGRRRSRPRVLHRAFAPAAPPGFFFRLPPPGPFPPCAARAPTQSARPR